MKNRKTVTHIIILAVLISFFTAILLKFGVAVYNDSDQYISMHMRREPVYPVFLYLIRSLFEDHWMIAAGVLQTLIVVVFSYRFILYISDVTGFGPVGLYIVTAFVLMPYIITPLISSTHVNLSVAIMSESIAMPMFLQFFIDMHAFLTGQHTRDAISGFIFALLISLTRSNLVILPIAWLIVALIVYIPRKKIIAVLLVIAAFISSFVIRDVVTKSYNLRFNERYVGNEYTGQTALANIFYACDREAGERIDDPELAAIFYTLYDDMNQRGWSYLYAGDSASERAVYLEDMHDRIKFEVIEFGLRDIIEATGIHDYIDYNAIAEDYCSQLIPALFPTCLSRWIPDMLIMGLRGIVRSVSVCTSWGYVYAAVIIAAAVCIMLILLRRDRRSPAAWMLGLSLLLILGNAFGTAMIIMCISRYMVYGFAVFYTSLLAGVCELYRGHR
ncbi:MAG: hypothetical protein K5673_10485 [Lachnospiraceae bacterium]|nr:hypothetical protein [Lachnospiraceae bacterium]